MKILSAVTSMLQSTLRATSDGSPVDGDVWYDATRLSRKAQVNGIVTLTPDVIYSQGLTSASIVNSAAEANMLAREQGLTSAYVGDNILPANWWLTNKIIRVRVQGEVQSSSGTVTFTLKIYYGGTILQQFAISVAIADGSKTFVCDVIIGCAVTGSSGALSIGGFIAHGAVMAAASSYAVAVNTTTAQRIVVNGVFSGATNVNAVIRVATMEVIG